MHDKQPILPYLLLIWNLVLISSFSEANWFIVFGTSYYFYFDEKASKSIVPKKVKCA